MSKKEFKASVRFVCCILFLLYFVGLIYFLLFAEMLGRAGAGQAFDYNLDLFQEIRRFWIYREQLGFAAVFLNLAGNILGFMPFGFLLPIIIRKFRGFIRTVLLGLASSFVIECIQFVTNTGTFDVDDLLLNTIGVALGFIVFAIMNSVRNRKKRGSRKRSMPKGDSKW